MTPARAGELVDRLDKVIRGSEMNLGETANLMVTVIREEAWRSRRIRTGEVVTCSSFLELLTAPPLKGFGEDPGRVEALLKDDAEALRMFRQATTVPKGSHHDNIIISKQGTARSYTLDRLHRQAPALYQQVVAGALSANAAAQQAGFRHKTVTVRPTVEGFASAAIRYLDHASLARLSQLLTEG